MADKNPITAMIIDDETDAIELLEMFLRRFPEVRVIGKESDARSGLEMIKINPPDLIFLDIDMPDMNGLTLADRIQTSNFHSEIVFTTAHQHYAYDALGIEPLDFLTKPFSVAELETVLRKFAEKAEKKEYQKKLDALLLSQNSPIIVKFPSTKGLLFVDLKEIVVIKARLHYTDLALADGTTETVIRNLTKTLEVINSPSFFQISRSTIINLKYLHRIDRKNQTCHLKINDKVIEEKMARGAALLLEKTVSFPFSVE
jgi:Response regulator of the LytR/AlgR family